MRSEPDASAARQVETGLRLVGISAGALVGLFVVVAWAVVPIELLVLSARRPVMPAASQDLAGLVAPLGLLAAGAFGALAASVLLLAVCHTLVRRATLRSLATAEADSERRPFVARIPA